MYLFGTNTPSITSVNGAININGIGGGTTSTNYGVNVLALGATSPFIALPPAAGTITLSGTQGGTTTTGLDFNLSGSWQRLDRVSGRRD